MVTFYKPTLGLMRGKDRHGSGHFHAPRPKNINKLHNGIDITAAPGEFVKSPIKGVIVREAIPYPNDLSIKGVVIEGTGEYAGLEVKIFYVMGVKCRNVDPGDVIGVAQDITKKYAGITNHIHMEVRQGGQIVSPMKFFNYCF